MTEPLFKNARFYNLRPEKVTCGNPSSRKGTVELSDGSLEVHTFPCPMHYDINDHVYFCSICGMKVAYEDYK